jgi:anti-anti-sigma factor
MHLQIDVKPREEGQYLVSLSGRLDSDTVHPCAQRLDELLKESVRMLVFDMAALQFISSMGIRLILNARKKIETYGGSLVMTNLQPQIEKVFDIAQVLPKANIFASVEEADAYYAAMQKRVLDEQKKP